MSIEKGILDENKLSTVASGVIKDPEEKSEIVEKNANGNLFEILLKRLKNRLEKVKGAKLSLVKKKSEEILEYEQIAGTIGILVFGNRYAGKNTLLLHLQQLFGDDPVSVDNFHAPIIHQVIIDGFKSIIEFSRDKGFDLSDYQSEIYEISKCRSDDPILPDHVLSFKRLWSSPFAQQAYDERKSDFFKYTPLEPLEHYIPRLQIICSQNYIPAFQDVIRIPVKYDKMGVRDLNIDIETIPFKFTALLNNSKSDIKKIGTQFEDPPIPISCLIFMCELPFTDPQSAQKEKPLPIAELIQDQLSLFKQIMSLKCFKNKVSCMVLLTKADLFFFQGLRFGSHQQVIAEIKKLFEECWTNINSQECNDNEEDESIFKALIDFKLCCNFNEKDVIEIILQMQNLIVASSSGSLC